MQARWIQWETHEDLFEVANFVDDAKLALISRESHVEMVWDHFSPRSVQSSPETFKDTFDCKNLSAIGTQVGALLGRLDEREAKLERGGIMAVVGEELEVATPSAESSFLWHFAFCSSLCTLPLLCFVWSLVAPLLSDTHALALTPRFCPLPGFAPLVGIPPVTCWTS
jgi:hypothetical protein